MQKNIFTILILFFFLKSQILVGQNSYKVEIIKSTDELPSNIIISSTKFNNYLYISTQRGISMYDGYEKIKNPYVKSYSSNLLWNNKQLYYFEDGLGIQKMNSIY